MTISPHPRDVLIIGSGIMGAAVARLLRQGDPTLRITMVDGGRAIGSAPGVHLHDVADPQLWEQYNERVASGIQGMYTGASIVADPVGDPATLTPGMHHSLSLEHEASEMPALALSWNVGGMGVHWTAATPWPAGDEVFDDGDPAQWQADLETARELLGVTPAPLGPTPGAGEAVLRTLQRRYDEVSWPGRAPQPMPMAVAPVPGLPRTGPGTIFPPIAEGGDPAFELRSGALAVRLLREGSTVSGAVVRDIATGEESELHAAAVIVCADAVRTPQLLFASGIRPEALGRHLNEHAFVTSRVLMDLDRFGLDPAGLPRTADGEFATDSLWLPHSGAVQPFHGQIMNRSYVDESGAPLAYGVGVSLYVPVESRPENRIEFSDDELDAFGMPRPTFRFAYSEADRALIARALDEVQAIAAEFGELDPQTELALLPPGSSLHVTGTVRSGASDDGTSVCDPEGRVWGFDGLYLAGTGVVPTPVACNATLTGTVTAVRAARAVAARLGRATSAPTPQPAPAA